MEVDDSETDEMTILRNGMIDHLIQNKDIVFKSQQIGDPDLTSEEKRSIVEECLKKPINFLTRFNQYMMKSHFEYLKRLYPECQYEIGFYLKENFSRKSETVVKNRRLEALKRLALESDYFTEEEMRKRNPLLYEQLVGKYLTEEERKEKSSFANTMSSEDTCKLSCLLMEQNERAWAIEFQKEQENAEEEVEMDSDDEGGANNESDLSDLDEKDDRVLHLWGESDSPSNYISTSKRITEGEKKLLFEEFRSHMYRDFIGGKDTDINYSEVDMNADYDDLDEIDRDAQDQYFSSDSPQDNMEVSSNGNADIPTGEVEATPCESINRTNRQISDAEDPLDTFMSELNQQEINSRLKKTVL